MCSNLMLIESVPGEPLSFHVIPFDNPRHQYTLQARSLEQKREWTLQLKRVILENYNAVIPSHARQLVMQLGQNRSDDEIMAERATPKKQHSAPEYLERRKQERRKSETGIRARLRTRSRKSDVGTCPKAQQRVRRNSQYPCEDGALSPTEITTEQCGGMRRKSEPGCYSNSVLREDTSEGVSTEQLHIPEEPTTQAEKKRTLEEIVSQLLMQNKEFQRVLKKQRHITRRQRGVETSEDEEEAGEGAGGTTGTGTVAGGGGGTLSRTKGGGSFSLSRSTRSLALNHQTRDSDYDNLHNVWDNGRAEGGGARGAGGLKRAQSFTSQGYSSPDTSLSGSQASFEGPTSPAVWLKQQQQHLATPTTNKAGSLPRGFQLGAPPIDWHHHRARISPDRPFTIASDKPQELNLEDMQHYVETQRETPLLTRHRFPLDDNTTEEESSTPDASTHNLDDVHPEYRIYRSGLSRATLRQVLSSVGGKLASLRLSSETLDQLDPENRANKIMQAFAKTFNKSKKSEESDLPVYKQGSSGLGARIAHGTETSDYADPRTLFPNITPSKKAASLLGIRPYSVLSLVSNLTSSSSSGYAGSSGSSSKDGRTPATPPQPPPPPPQAPPKRDDNTESDGSADSYYERTFEAMESTMDVEVYRDSAIFSEPEDILEHYMPKLMAASKKVPPPVPEKPTNLKAILRSVETTKSVTVQQCSGDKSSDNSPVDRQEDECDSSSVASTVIEATTTKGWVKHVICKIQGESNN